MVSRLATVMVALMVLRAAIPIGYMPDVSGLADGVVRILICTGEGLRPITVDGTGAPVAPPTAGSGAHGPGDTACPFVIATAATLAAAMVIVLGVVPRPANDRPARLTVPVIAEHSPGALGARAPPWR